MTQNQFATYHYRHSEVMVWHTQHPDHDIDRISGRGTWQRNPWVYAYTLELIK